MSKGNALKPFNVILDGTRLPNDDGVIRQDIIKKCKVGDKLTLVYDPHVSEAVKVKIQDGTLIGFIPPEQAVEIASRLKKKILVEAEISKISGGGFFKRAVKCEVQITKYTQ